MEKLTRNEIDYNLTTLKGWKVEDDGIVKDFVFKDFKEALSIINAIGVVAEELNHHPEFYNVYNKLDIRLSTHDVGGVTLKDFELAHEIEEICNK